MIARSFVAKLAAPSALGALAALTVALTASCESSDRTNSPATLADAAPDDAGTAGDGAGADVAPSDGALESSITPADAGLRAHSCLSCP